MNIALIGNPNCGKTTLFNLLTGNHQKVGNWTGVTVEKKEGRILKDKSVTIVDLPGIYSLNSLTADEKAVTNYLTKTPPDVIINVIDGTNLERNLYLTTKLTTRKIPIICAINLADELDKNGININYAEIQKKFGINFVPISALKNLGIDNLLKKALNTKRKPDNLEEKYTLINNDKTYNFIASVLHNTIVKKELKSEKFTQRADSILTNKFLGFPIFFLVITLVYFISSEIGGFFGTIIDSGVVSFTNLISNLMMDSPKWLRGIICDAVLKGVGSILTFLPNILVLFFMLSLLEQCGYMSRVSFITDKLLRRVGLGGKSLIPLVLSCGCTVTGLMATRTIQDEKERKTAIYLSPFMPCGAKVAVFGWLSNVFFNGDPFISASLYFISIIVVFLSGFILTLIGRNKDIGNFILEMPTLKIPSIKDVFYVLKEKTKEFLIKAGTIIFAVSIILWFLMNFGIYGYTENVENSFIYFIGNIIKFIFIPLGFGNWQASVSVLSGILAKEAVIETLELVSSSPLNLFANNFSVYAFMTFVLFSAPCVATLSQAKRELGSSKKMVKMALGETLVAYLVALIINTFGLVYLKYKSLIFILFIVIILMILFILSLKRILKGKCCNCSGCKNGEKKCKKKHNTII